MRKYGILAVLMAFVVAVTSGCGLIIKDAAVDAQTVIIEVAGRTFVKAEVKQAIENVLDYQEYIYSMYGMTFDRTEADTLASAQETALNALVEEAVTGQKVTELGMDQFTDEELAAINTKADESYASIVDSVKTTYFAETVLTGEELDAAITAKITEIGYGSRESLLEQEKLTASLDKLRTSVVKDITVGEDEIQTSYNSGVANAVTAYATTPTQYASDVRSGAILYYQPAGYRYVKNLLIKLSDEDKTALQTLATQISDQQETLTATHTAIAELPEDPATDTEDQKKSREELLGQEAALNTDIQTLTTQLDEKTISAYAAIQPTVDEVVAKLAADGDFEALLTEYGQDSGMTVEPQKTQGYLVCSGLTTYLEVFVNEAMALQNIGDVSEPFRSSAGIHILKYESNLQEGQSGLAAIHDQISAELLSQKQDSTYDETLNQWIADAKAKVYEDKLAD